MRGVASKTVLLAVGALWWSTHAYAQADATSELRALLDSEYSFRDLDRVDWNAAFAEEATGLRSAGTPTAFAERASALLARARDVHISIAVGERVLYPYRRAVSANYDLGLIHSLVPDVQSDHHCVSWGHTVGGAGYVLIGEWTRPCAVSALRSLDALSDESTLIIDVRGNSGGDDSQAALVAGRFTSADMVYASVQRITRGHTSAREPRHLMPTAPRYRGRVVILMGPRCMSSNESFLLMMRAAGATLIGSRSFGSSGNPQPHRLSNGVVVNLPSWREYQLDGSAVERRGIDPDVVISWHTPAADDPILRAADLRLKSR